jgi:hypothetical protein
MKKVSIIIPYIRESVHTTILTANWFAGIPKSEYEILAEEDKERIGCPRMVKRLVEKSQGDLICFLGDDSIPDHDFLKFAIEDMHQQLPQGWGLVGFNDRTGRTLPTHWLADNRLLPHLDNEYFHTGYTHCFCDNELMIRCHELGRYYYSKRAVVIHNHPILTGHELTGDYARVYAKEVYEKDRQLFEKRRDNGWK